jgi:hypothetical protein
MPCEFCQITEFEHPLTALIGTPLSPSASTTMKLPLPKKLAVKPESMAAYLAKSGSTNYSVSMKTMKKRALEVRRKTLTEVRTKYLMTKSRPWPWCRTDRLHSSCRMIMMTERKGGIIAHSSTAKVGLVQLLDYTTTLLFCTLHTIAKLCCIFASLGKIKERSFHIRFRNTSYAHVSVSSAHFRSLLTLGNRSSPIPSRLYGNDWECEDFGRWEVEGRRGRERITEVVVEGTTLSTKYPDASISHR